uniref:Uncharacterized protein n=1 Tax=Clytia hemisphaerica TaxID=252671 RepID=A0A7M5VCZ5_9CNID
MNLSKSFASKSKAFFQMYARSATCPMLSNSMMNPLSSVRAPCGQEVHRECYLNILKDMNLVDHNEAIRDRLFKIQCQSCQENTVSFTHDSNTPNPPRSTESQEKSTWSVVDEDYEINAPMTEDDTSNTLNQTARGPPNEINLNNSNQEQQQSRPISWIKISDQIKDK